MSVIGLFLLHLLLDIYRTQPVFVEDELGYLANARYLAGTRTTPDLGPMGFYFPGYSLLLAPLYLLLDDPADVYRGALTLNAALASAIVVPLYFAGRDLLTLPPREAVLAATVTAAYPGVLLMSGFVFADNLFPLAFVVYILIGFKFAQHRSLRWAIPFGMLAGFLYTTHPRGLVVLVVSAAFLVFTWLAGVVRLHAATTSLVVMGAATLATQALNRALIAAMYPGGSGRSAVKVLSVLFNDPDLWFRVPIRAAGQFWYLGIASAGLLPLGVVFLFKSISDGGSWPRSEKRLTHPRALGAALLLAGALAIFVMTAVASARGARVDHWVYGRYNDGFAPMLFLAGIAYLLSSTHLRVARDLLLALPPIVLAAVVTIVGNGGLSAFEGRHFCPVCVLGVVPYLPRPNTLDVPVITLGAAGVILAVAVGSLRSRTIGVTVLLAVLVGGGVLGQRRILEPFTSPFERLATLHRAVARVGAPDTIGYDDASVSVYGLNPYQFWLDRTRFMRFNSDAGEEAPVPLIIAGKERSGGTMEGARMVAAEKFLDQALWALPGNAQEQLAARGLLLPVDPCGQLPERALRSNLELVGQTRRDLEMGAAESLTLRMHVEHAGVGSPWLQLGALPCSPRGSVRLGARWIPEGDPLWKFTAAQLADLPHTLLPGQSVEVGLNLLASGPNGPLQEGQYLVRIGPLQEGIRWFDEVGDGTLDLTVTVVQAQPSDI